MDFRSWPHSRTLARPWSPPRANTLSRFTVTVIIKPFQWVGMARMEPRRGGSAAARCTNSTWYGLPYTILAQHVVETHFAPSLLELSALNHPTVFCSTSNAAFSSPTVASVVWRTLEAGEEQRGAEARAGGAHAGGGVRVHARGGGRQTHHDTNTPKRSSHPTHQCTQTLVSPTHQYAQARP